VFFHLPISIYVLDILVEVVIFCVCVSDSVSDYLCQYLGVQNFKQWPSFVESTSPLKLYNYILTYTQITAISKSGFWLRESVKMLVWIVIIIIIIIDFCL